MNKFSNKSFASRFRGKQGKHSLVNVLLQSVLLGGNKKLIEDFVKNSLLIEYKKNKTIIVQGNPDNDLYLIVSGSCSVIVNGREVAKRNSGNHFGEIALMDSTSLRSATVVTNEHTIVLKINEFKFSKLANKYPILWKRIALEIANRLRERNRFLGQPNTKPVVFIGSSSEGLLIADKIYGYLNKKPVIPKIWTNDVFKPSNTTIEDLMNIKEVADFAIIVLTPDDITKSRGNTQYSPRDNAILELGIFMGGINRERTILIKPTGVDIKIPSDLFGVTCLQYVHFKRKPIDLKNLKSQIIKHINQLGPR